nr:unnamed protein product [Callosobruchus chinensis]
MVTAFGARLLGNTSQRQWFSRLLQTTVRAHI